MKKLVFVFLFLSAISISSYSQTNFGIRGGLNVSNIVGKYYNDYDFLLGAHAGVFMRFSSDESFYFQPEVLLSMKGNSFRDQAGAGKYVHTLRLNYIDIPLMLGVKPFDNFSFLVGIQPSVLVNAKGITRYAGKRTTGKVGGINTLDFGPVAGIQIERDSGFDFGIRASYGLINVSGSSSAFHNRNLNFMATIGYAFGK